MHMIFTKHGHNNMKNKIIFINKPSIVGNNKQMLIYIPVVIKKLIDPEKEYKITLEEIETVEEYKKRLIDEGIAEFLKKNQA